MSFKAYKLDMLSMEGLLTDVEVYTEALIAAKPIVSGSLPPDEETNRCKRCGCYGCVCDALDGI